ncbi:YIEGIA family protein [Schinkia sp. CFF1]
MHEFTYPIIFGVVVGTIARLYMLRTDYRQYPTYLHGRIIHIATGFIAAALGTVAIPSIMKQEFTAITFLALAASQFREVRNMERTTLQALDELELVPRGKTYIEGIAIAFEGRNYIVILTSFITTLTFITINWWAAVIAGIICLLIAKKLMSGGKLKDIVDIEEHELHFEEAGLLIDNIYIMNVGLPERQEEILKYGMGFILKPKSFNVRPTIANLGQRQAILHDISIALGIYRDSGTPALVPIAKRDLDDGRVAVFVLPQIREVEKAIRVIGHVPILENAIRLPNESVANKRG